MSLKTKSDPRKQLNRGLDHASVGTGDITRGVVALTSDAARTGFENLRRRYEDGELAQQLSDAPENLAKEWAAAQDVMASLPQALQDARNAQYRRGSRWKKVAVAAVLVGGTAAVVSLTRGSSGSDQPAPQPPNANAQPRP